jgi:hypothetical protein
MLTSIIAASGPRGIHASPHKAKRKRAPHHALKQGAALGFHIAGLGVAMGGGLGANIVESVVLQALGVLAVVVGLCAALGGIVLFIALEA